MHTRLTSLLVSWTLVLGFLASAAQSALAGPRIDIVTGPNPAPLIQLAADELTIQLRGLFDAEVVVAPTPPAKSEHLILLGQPTTNPALASAIGQNWPQLSDQGFILRSVQHNQQPALLVGGGSPRAALWAAYELGHHFGIRSLVSGDILPPVKPALGFDKIDIVREPVHRSRLWKLNPADPLSTGGWTLAEQQQFIRQLARLKFTGLVIELPTDAPFVKLEFNGITAKGGQLFGGGKLTIESDTPGRRGFKGAKELTNPDLAGKPRGDELTTAGIALVRGLIDAAHARGLTADIEIAPLHFPAEFAAVLPPAKETGTKDVIYVSGSEALADPRAYAAAAAQVKAYLATYPAVDTFHFPNFGGEEELPLLTRLSAVVPRVAPPNTTRTRAMGNITPRSRTTLPAFTAQLLHVSLTALQNEPYEGFVAIGSVSGEWDRPLHYLSRAAFEKAITPAAADLDLYGTLCARKDVAERLMEAFDLTEQAAKTAPASRLLGVPSDDFKALLNGEKDAGTDLAALKEIQKLHTGSMNELYRAHDNTHPSARRFLFYHCKHGEFALHYTTALIALQEAAALKPEDAEKRLELLEKATESLYNGMNALGEVARDPCDRAVIAILNRDAYRPLIQKVEELSDQLAAE